MRGLITLVPELRFLLGRLAAIGAPTVLFQLITLIFMNSEMHMFESLDAIEYFAGEMAVSQLNSVSMELCDSCS